MKRILTHLYVAIVVFGCSGVVDAALHEWDGGGGSNKWSVPENWNPDSVPSKVSNVEVANFSSGAQFEARIFYSDYPSTSPAMMASLDTWYGGGAITPYIVHVSGYVEVDDGIAGDDDNVTIGRELSGGVLLGGEYRLFSASDGSGGVLVGDLAIFGDMRIHKGVFNNFGGNHHHEPGSSSPKNRTLFIGGFSDSEANYVVDQSMSPAGVSAEANLTVHAMEVGTDGGLTNKGVFKYVLGNLVDINNITVYQEGTLDIDNSLVVSGDANLVVDGGKVDVAVGEILTVKSFRWIAAPNVSRKMTTGSTISVNGSTIDLSDVQIQAN